MRLLTDTTLILIMISLTNSLLWSQILAPSMKELEDRYPQYLESTISGKRFEVEDLIPIFDRLSENSDIQFSVNAHSLQNRPIYLASFGHGEIPVLMWSQMHGDESTATMALLDLFNFLSSENMEDQAFIEAIKERLTLHFIPMLNPDGASKFQRRNASLTDLNRDALDLSNPESRFLKSVRDSLEPVFGFNLHDQSIYYRAGRNGKQVALAFLAPAYDFDKTINDVRMRSMQLIAHLHDSLQMLIPQRIAIYDDSFEPRAFGDNIQKWGTSTILIESGGYPDDPEKQYLRQLNFITLIKSLESIMSGSYEEKTVEEYQSIPENERRMLSLIIEDLKIPVENQNIRMDIGYTYYEIVEDSTTYYPANIADVGDLSTYTGFEVFPAEDFEVIAGKWYPDTMQNIRDLADKNWKALIREGFLGFLIASDSGIGTNFTPFLIYKNPQENDERLDLVMAPGKDPTFILQARDTNDRFVVHNGKIHPIERYISLVEQELNEINDQ